MRGLRTSALALLVAVSCQAGSPVLWRPTRIQDLVQASDLVVLGAIREIRRAPPGPSSVDEAVLVVDRTLRGHTSSSRIRLLFPGLGRDGAGHDPTSIRYEIDQDGIFFLLRQQDGSYVANHPARFKPRFFLTRILNELGAF